MNHASNHYTIHSNMQFLLLFYTNDLCRHSQTRTVGYWGRFHKAILDLSMVLDKSKICS